MNKFVVVVVTVVAAFLVLEQSEHYITFLICLYQVINLVNFPSTFIFFAILMILHAEVTNEYGGPLRFLYN